MSVAPLYPLKRSFQDSTKRQIRPAPGVIWSSGRFGHAHGDNGQELGSAAIILPSNSIERMSYAVCMRFCILLAATLLTTQTYAQWNLQDSHTTVALQSVHAVSENIAWVGGAEGTVLRTQDGGTTWKSCVVPKGAEKLDFSGIQGLDENTAIVVSTGKGDLSRLYKTVDGCQTWKLVFTNPDAGGSFRSLHRMTDKQAYLLGDPVDGKFSVFYSSDGGDSWLATDDPGLDADKGAIANASLMSVGPFLLFGAHGPASLQLYQTYSKCDPGAQSSDGCSVAWAKTEIPLNAGDPDHSEFAVAAHASLNMRTGNVETILVAVGDSPTGAGAAVVSRDGGKNWKSPATSLSGNRSIIAYYAAAGSWLAVGQSGVDASSDDGKTWHPLASVSGSSKDAAPNWSALSLPFVVGDKGQIGKMNLAKLQH